MHESQNRIIMGYNSEARHNYDNAEASHSYKTSILRKLKIPQGSSVLDVGSGAGNEANQLRLLYKAKVFEFEVQDTAYKVNPETGRNYVAGDYEKLPYPDESFELVHIKDAFIHLPKKESFFSEAHRVLKPGGKLLLVCYIETLHSINDPFVLAWKDDFTMPIKYSFKERSMKDYMATVEKIKNEPGRKGRLEISPPYFPIKHKELLKIAKQTGFTWGDHTLPVSWTPAEGESNWGEFNRGVYLFQKYD